MQTEVTCNVGAPLKIGGVILLHPNPTRASAKYSCTNPDCYFGTPPSQTCKYQQSCEKCKETILIGSPIRIGNLSDDQTTKSVHVNCEFKHATPVLSSVETRRKYAGIAQVEDDTEPFLKNTNLSFETPTAEK